MFCGVFFQLNAFSCPLMRNGRGAVLSVEASAHPTSLMLVAIHTYFIPSIFPRLCKQELIPSSV